MRALVAIVLLAALAGCPSDERAAGPLPGAPAFEAALARRLARAARQRDAETKPRTRHLGPDGAPRYTNRLVLTAAVSAQPQSRAECAASAFTLAAMMKSFSCSPLILCV